MEIAIIIIGAIFAMACLYTIVYRLHHIGNFLTGKVIEFSCLPLGIIEASLFAAAAYFKDSYLFWAMILVLIGLCLLLVSVGVRWLKRK